MKVICTATGGCVIAEDAPIERDCPRCPYYTTVQRVEVGTAAEYWQMRYEEACGMYEELLKVSRRALEEYIPDYEELSDAFDNALACYEELAGEHRELWEAFMRDAEALSTPCPGDPEDYTFVRAYYRPRRSKLAAIEPDHPTVQAAPGEGQSGASGDVVGASIDCPECDLVFASLEEYGDHYRNLHSGHPLTEVARVSVEHGPEWYGEERSE